MGPKKGPKTGTSIGTKNGALQWGQKRGSTSDPKRAPCVQKATAQLTTINQGTNLRNQCGCRFFKHLAARGYHRGSGVSTPKATSTFEFVGSWPLGKRCARHLAKVSSVAPCGDDSVVKHLVASVVPPDCVYHPECLFGPKGLNTPCFVCTKLLL